MWKVHTLMMRALPSRQKSTPLEPMEAESYHSEKVAVKVLSLLFLGLGHRPLVCGSHTVITILEGTFL